MHLYISQFYHKLIRLDSSNQLKNEYDKNQFKKLKLSNTLEILKNNGIIILDYYSKDNIKLEDLEKVA